MFANQVSAVAPNRSDSSSHLHEEQTELLAKVNRLTMPVRVFSMGSGVFLLVLLECWSTRS